MLVGFLYLVILTWLAHRAFRHQSTDFMEIVGCFLAAVIFLAIMTTLFVELINIPQKTAATLAFGCTGLILWFTGRRKTA